jgi:glycosyltransferase involved in cell wall biosynthesis
MRICLIGNCVTAQCLERRKNQRYLSASGRKKVLQVATCLRDSGHEVTILSASYSPRCALPSVELRGERLRICHAPAVGGFGHAMLKKTLLAAYACWHVLVRQRYDLVLAYNWQVEFSAPALAASALGRSVAVLDYEDGLFHDRRYRTWFYRHWERFAYRHFRGAVLVNEGLQSRIAELGESMATTVVHGLLDPAILLADPSPRSPSHPIRLVFTGNLGWEFGFEELLAYLRHLPDDVRLDITGRGPAAETDAIKEAVAGHPNAAFHGFLGDSAFAELIAQADAVLLLNQIDSPYNQTNFPSKLFDYLARQKVVVTTANPLLAPYLDLPGVVVVADPADCSGLAQRIRTSACDPARVRRLDEETRSRLCGFLEGLCQKP